MKNIHLYVSKLKAAQVRDGMGNVWRSDAPMQDLAQTISIEFTLIREHELPKIE